MKDNNNDGMTINERLHYFNLFDKFDQAIMNRDNDEIIRILKLARLSEAQAEETADAILAHPEKYGY